MVDGLLLEGPDELFGSSCCCWLLFVVISGFLEDCFVQSGNWVFSTKSRLAGDTTAACHTAQQQPVTRITLPACETGNFKATATSIDSLSDSSACNLLVPFGQFDQDDDKSCRWRYSCMVAHHRHFPGGGFC